MIKSIRLKNFQSHRDTLIRICTGFNVIKGTSMSGKTSILRGYRWLTENRPLGAKYYSHFAPNSGEMSVEIVLDDNRVVSLTKAVRRDKAGVKSVVSTTYKIDGLEYSAPKDKVPDEIVRALNVSELNLQRQFDKPFLVAPTSSGGEVAKTINKIIRLEGVDGWVSEWTSEINQLNRDAKLRIASISNIEKEISKYDDLEDIKKLLEKLNVVANAEGKLRAEAEAIDTTLEHLEKHYKDLYALQEAMSAERYVNRAEIADKWISDVDVFEDRINTVSIFAKEIDDLACCISDVDAIIKKVDACETESEEKELGRFSDFLIKLKSDISALEKGEREYQDAKQEYKALLKKLKVCPFCLTAITDKHIDELVKKI